MVAEIYTRKNIFIPLYVGHPNQLENSSTTNFENDNDINPPPSKKAKITTDKQNVGNIVTIQPAEDLIGKRNNLTSITQPLPLIDKVKTEKEGIENVKLVAKGFPTDIQQLDMQIKSLMSVGNTVWKWKNSTKKKYACTVCGKEDYFSNIKRHIELYHIEGVNVSCSLCEKMYKTRLALKNHMQVCNKS